MKSEMIPVVLVFFPFAAGLLCYGIGYFCEKRHMKKNIKDGQETLRDYFAMIAVLTEFLISFTLWRSGAFSFLMHEICGFGLHFAVDGFRIVYVNIASFMWMMVTILSKQYFTHHRNRNRFYLFLLWTLGAVMGVFLSADLITTYVFFEIMSFTSYVWVAQEENRPSLRAAQTYLAIAVIGGLVMLMGIFLLYNQLGTVEISKLLTASANCSQKEILYLAGGCMLVGFGAKAGSFPLHIWLPKAHPAAPAPASALLSGILTKTGIYGMLLMSVNLFLYDRLWGKLILLLGVATMFIGALLAVFSIDIKRTLACSSMSQIGFIMVGIGMQGVSGAENELAVRGTLLHMMNHSLIKLVLFMVAGVIFMNIHALDLNKIRGFGRKKPLLAAIFLTGALSIAGIPFFSGYISKTLLHESILVYRNSIGMILVEGIFLLSGGLTFAYMTKLFIAVFVEKNEDEALQKEYDEKKSYMNAGSGFALTVSAAVLFVFGLFPHTIMERAAAMGRSFMHVTKEGHMVSYFALSNLKGAIISILIGMIVYTFLIRKFLMKKREDGKRIYINAWPSWMDLETMLYRPVLLTILPAVFGVLCRVLDSLTDVLVVLLRKSFFCDSPLPYELPEGNMFTKICGKILNAVQSIGNHTWNRQEPRYRDYVHLAAVKNEELMENNRIIQRSLSFGLMLAAIGISLTLVYIIWW